MNIQEILNQVYREDRDSALRHGNPAIAKACEKKIEALASEARITNGKETDLAHAHAE